jgi:hypothetical protein
MSEETTKEIEVNGITLKQFYVTFGQMTEEFAKLDKDKTIKMLEKIRAGSAKTIRRLRTNQMGFEDWEEKEKEVNK